MTNKEDLKFKYKIGCELEKRIDKVIKVFPNSYHDLVYMDNINFQLYGVDTNISKYANQWVAEVENISRIEHEEISDERLINFYKEFSFHFY